MGLIPGLGRSAGVVNDNLLFVTMGSQRVRHDWAMSMLTCLLMLLKSHIWSRDCLPAQQLGGTKLRFIFFVLFWWQRTFSFSSLLHQALDLCDFSLPPSTLFTWLWYFSLARNSLGVRQWYPTPVLLPGKSHGLEEPGGLQSMGSLRVGRDWATSLSLFTFMHWRRKWQPTPVFLPGESQGRGSLVGCCLWGHTESDATEAT